MTVRLRHHDAAKHREEIARELNDNAGSMLEIEDNGSSLTTDAIKINFVGFTVSELADDEITVEVGDSIASTLYAPGYTSYTRVDDDTFTIDLVNAEHLFYVGRRLRFEKSGAYDYGVISSVDYNITNANDTTVNLTMEGTDTVPTGTFEVSLTSSATSWSPIAGDPCNGGQINCVRTGPISGTQYWIICGNDGKIAYSTDSGESWATSSSGTSEHLNCICYDSRNEEFYIVGDQQTFLKSTNGTTWSTVTESFSATGDDFYSIAYNYAGDYFVMCWYDDSGADYDDVKSDDAWATATVGNWSGQLKILTGVSCISDTNSSSQLRNYENGGGTLRYANYAVTSASNTITAPSLNVSAQASFWIDGAERWVCAEGNGDLFTLPTIGAGNVEDDVTNSETINDFAFSSSHDRVVGVGTNQKIVYIDYADWGTVDSWNSVSNGFNPTANILSVDRNDSDGVFVAVADNGQIARSSNGTDL